MRMIKLVLPAAILMAFGLIATTVSYGTPAYAKKEGKSCTFCHAKVEAKDAVSRGPQARSWAMPRPTFSTALGSSTPTP